MGETLTPLSSLVGAIEPFEVGVGVFWVFWLLTDTVSIISLSPLLTLEPVLSFPTPTASRKRLYNPLRPFCIISPANPLFSALEEEDGGEANSLKVVRVSERQAVLCILSKAWASCSLSTEAGPETEAREPRREPRPSGSKLGGAEGLGESCEDMVVLAEYAQRVSRRYCLYGPVS